MLLNNVISPGSMPLISEDILIYFVAHCHSVLKLKYPTIKLYICGIRFHYLQAGVLNPFSTRTGSQLVRLHSVLNGVKRQTTTARKPRYPITFPVLSKMCDKLLAGTFSPYTDMMMLAAVSVAFFGFLRCGELTCHNSFDPTTHLCMGDVTFREDHVQITLKKSKTDPFRQGVDIRLYTTNHPVCPYIFLHRYVSARLRNNATPTDPLFVTALGQPMNRRYFIQCTKDVLLAIGLQSDLYNGHSYRIGAATTCASHRIEDHLIKTMGRWNSDCYTRYIHTPPSAICAAQRTLTNL
jgi:hypothetical protein